MKALIICLFSIISTAFIEDDGLTISDEKVQCVISRNTTLTQLKKYKAELLTKKNIQLDIEHIETDKKGILTTLKISVDCRDGFKGSTQSNFDDEKTKMNFYRLYKKGVDSPFGIGKL